jgi:hypothetical protein
LALHLHDLGKFSIDAIPTRNMLMMTSLLLF